MTLSPKRAIDAAGGSLPGRELSIGLRDGDGSAAGWTSTLKSQISTLSLLSAREALINSQSQIS